jgi:hypothetical protein
MKGRGPAWFGAWLVVGAALTFCFLTGFSIGLFVLPFALVLLRSSRRGRRTCPRRPGSSAGSV